MYSPSAQSAGPCHVPRRRVHSCIYSTFGMYSRPHSHETASLLQYSTRHLYGTRDGTTGPHSHETARVL